MTCDVYLISDSNMTQLLLEDWLTKQNCSMDIADHTIDAITTEQTVESAEVRGRIQFFQELDWASMARTAFVGHAKNTLSHILLERIEYKRRMEIRKLGRDPPIIPTLAKCTW